MDHQQGIGTKSNDFVIPTANKQEKTLSAYERLLRVYNDLFNRSLTITDYDLWLFSKLAYRNDGIFQRFVNRRDRRRFHIAQFISTEDGLQFYVISSRLTKDIVIAFRGTDEWKDWLTNVQILKGKKGQFTTAANHLESVFRQYPNHRFYFCGHSLGGALAQYLFVFFFDRKDVTLKRAVTFNSAGVRLKNEPSYVEYPIVNYIIKKDIVGTVTGYHYGKVYLCRPNKTTGKLDAIKFVTHSLDQFSFDPNGNVITEQNLISETGS